MLYRVAPRHTHTDLTGLRRKRVLADPGWLIVTFAGSHFSQKRGAFWPQYFGLRSERNAHRTGKGINTALRADLSHVS